MFEFAEVTKDMTASEILNYYRNLYYAEPQVTERGIVANAINDYVADVVPKSEVEELKREYESLAKTVNEVSELIRKLRSKVEKSKTELAREIFEEIYEDCFDQYGYINYEALDELKKKYTEDHG